MNLLERIDLALQHARKSRGELAKSIGIQVQSISNLKRKPGSSMRPENLARAARWMKCDVYWLCTGEPEGYTPEVITHERFGVLASEVARWLDALPLAEQERAFARIYQVCRDINSQLALGAGKRAEGDDGRGSARP